MSAGVRAADARHEERAAVRRGPAIAIVGLVVAALAWLVAGGGFTRALGVSLGAVASPIAPVTGGTPAPCSLADLPAPHGGREEWARTILDTAFTLGPEYVPADLVPVAQAGITGHGQVRSLVIADLQAMTRASNRAGAGIAIGSAYRSYADQVLAFDSYQAAYGTDEALRSVARAGHSEHQLGTTIDFTGDLDWLAASAWRYGFVMSYPAAASPGRTCYKPEPWHYRYVGRATAAAVHRSGLSLREWLWARAG